MRRLAAALFKLIGIGAMGFGIFIIIKWYTLWISYYFIGNIKPSVVIACLTFFLSPLAALIDLFWHSFAKPTVDMWIYFLAYFAGGRIVFFIGEKLSYKE